MNKAKASGVLFTMLDRTHSTMANVVEAYLFRDLTQVASEVFMIRREKHKLDKVLGSAVSTIVLQVLLSEFLSAMRCHRERWCARS
jgi:hypothetical protein